MNLRLDILQLPLFHCWQNENEKWVIQTFSSWLKWNRCGLLEITTLSFSFNFECTKMNILKIKKKHMLFTLACLVIHQTRVGSRKELHWIAVHVLSIRCASWQGTAKKKKASWNVKPSLEDEYWKRTLCIASNNRKWIGKIYKKSQPRYHPIYEQTDCELNRSIKRDHTIAYRDENPLTSTSYYKLSNFLLDFSLKVIQELHNQSSEIGAFAKSYDNQNGCSCPCSFHAISGY